MSVFRLFKPSKTIVKQENLMLEVIYAGSLFLSVNPFLPNNSPDLALIHASQSALVQPDVLQLEKSPGLYLAETEAEAEYRQNLEQLMDRFNIIIQDPNSDEDSSDDDAEQRRRELEQEDNDYDGVEDSGNDHESDYRQQAEDARNGDEYDVDVSDSDEDEDSSDRDAAERRRELEAEHHSNDGDETEDSGDEHTSDYRQQAEDARNGDFSSSDDNSDEDEDSSDDDAKQRRQELGF
jgi:hypothetical protein